MRIALGSDHGGYRLKEAIKEHLTKKGHFVTDYGTDSIESVDYPDYAEKLCHGILNGEADRGILICGTGIGIAIAANKVKGIRCATVSDVVSAKKCVEHNNCQVVSLGERTIGFGLALELVEAFLTATFEGDRHQRRVDKIMEIENQK